MDPTDTNQHRLLQYINFTVEAVDLEGALAEIDVVGIGDNVSIGVNRRGFVLDGLTAVAQVRVFAPLPWSENFESGRPPFWIGGGGSLAVEDLGGNQVFRKGASRTGIHRHAIYMGPADMSGYTVQVDVLSTQQGRRRPDIGLINSGYTMDLQGNRQKVQIQSWSAELRI